MVGTGWQDSMTNNQGPTTGTGDQACDLLLRE